MQSRKYSFIESIANVAIGYFVALTSQIIIFPFFDIHISIADNIVIGAWFTVISICRSYLVRRFFTRLSSNM